MNYLGLDLGASSLGVAISKSGIIASDLLTLYFANLEEATLKLLSLIKEQDIHVLVLGNPKHMNNDISSRSKKTLLFKELILDKNPEIKIILWDERLSTKSALQTLKMQNKKYKKYKKKLKDQLAAKIILQSYLDFSNN